MIYTVKKNERKKKYEKKYIKLTFIYKKYNLIVNKFDQC